MKLTYKALSKKEINKIIDYQVTVDCYTEEEVNLGWAIYMEDHLHYPFEAEYLQRKQSGESQWKKVKVVGNKTNESSFNGGAYYVEIVMEEQILLANLEELRNIKADQETMKALQVWHHR